jgi:predicted secreted protein
MPTLAIAAIGTLLKAGDGASPEVFTTLAEVRDIDGPSMTAEEIDVTNHSTVGNFAESIPGLLDAGSLSFAHNWIFTDASQALLEADYLARVRRTYRLVFPVDAAATAEADRTWEFEAYVQQLGVSAPVRDALTRNTVLRVVGAPTLGI